MLRVALDTNVLLEAVPSHGRYHAIIDALAAHTFCLVVSSEILFEYREALDLRGGPRAWEQFADLLGPLREDGVALLEVSPKYQCRAIHIDADDNKFVDAAFAADADFVITSDKHFRALSTDSSIRTKPIHPRLFISTFLE